MKAIMKFTLIVLLIFVLSGFLYGSVKDFESSQQCNNNPLTQCMCWSDCSSDETGAMDREKTCNIDCGDDDGAVCCYVKSKGLGLDSDQSTTTSGTVHFSLKIGETEQTTNIQLEESKSYTFKFVATGDYVNLCTAKLEYKSNKPADADKVIQSKEQFTCKTGESIYFEVTSSYKQYSPLQITLLSYPKDFDTSRILADPTDTQSQKVYNVEII